MMKFKLIVRLIRIKNLFVQGIYMMGLDLPKD